MQADAVSKKALKQWYVKRTPAATITILCLRVIFPNKDDLFYYAAWDHLVP